MAEPRGFGNYHRVLNRAVWSARQTAVDALDWHLIPPEAIVLELDDTLRRQGKRIKATGLYRDVVRSTDSQVVKVSGFRSNITTLQSYG